MTMQRRIKTLLILAAVAMALIAGTAHAQLSSQLGILDLDANNGINPGTGNAWAAGDTYHLVFISSTTRNGQSSAIADYDAHVQAAADATTIYDMGVDEGVTWKAIASVVGTSALSNTGTAWTVQEPGFPIFRLDSVNVAASYMDLWAATERGADPGNLNAPINLTEINQANRTGNVWTGSGGTGNARDPLGQGVGSFDGIGQAQSVDREWIWHRFNQANNGSNYRIYAFSEPLTVSGAAIPEPSTFVLAALGLLGLLGFARRGRK